MMAELRFARLGQGACGTFGEFGGDGLAERITGLSIAGIVELVHYLWKRIKKNKSN